MSKKPTRRKFLKTVGVGLALVGLTGCERIGLARGIVSSEGASSARHEETMAFRSRPDLGPPAIEVSTPARGTADGYVFVAPKEGSAQFGPMIVDDRGELVWFRALPAGDYYRATDFKAQRYRGEPVITWWEGTVEEGHGLGGWVILDGSYREVAWVQAAGGYEGDLHEFRITDNDTALITIYGTVPLDLTSIGGSGDGEVTEGVIQELDIETGELIFEWHSLDHVGPWESYERPEDDAPLPFDYFHINSIAVDRDGDLLVSARNTSAVYKIDRETGRVIWRLGGRASDFTMGPGSQSVYQHDAIPRPDGTITIFDNGVSGVEDTGWSRGIVIELDEAGMFATLAREYPHPAGVRAATQANMQTLPNGNIFIGWGSEPLFSEFAADGELLFDAVIQSGAESYRAFRFSWTALPADEPAVAARRGPGGEVTLYSSWNGATEVADWEILAGPAPGRLDPVGTVPRRGFETVSTVRTAEQYVAARARGRSGRVLGDSGAVEPGG